jgi:Gpi18-like mannosyltransferase
MTCDRESISAPAPRLAARLRRLVVEHGGSCLVVALGVAITIIIRAQVFDFHSGDLYDCLMRWCDKIEKMGLANALRTGDINYNTPYLYLLWLATKLPFHRALFLKVVAIGSDYLCAAAVAAIVLRIHRSRLRAAVAAFALLVTPTVVFNSAMWGQCDMIYTSLLMVALAAALKGRLDVSTALFALAFAIKLQALFLFPMLAIWVVRRELRWSTLVLVPTIFLICLLPAWGAGSSFVELLGIYPHQTGQESSLTVSAPTIFAMLPDEGRWLSGFGLWFAVAAIFMVALACIYTRVATTPMLTIQQATVFSCLVPFLLPHMHDRYVFIGDVMSVLYAFLVPRRFWIALFVVGASFTSYFSYLFGKVSVPLPLAAVLLGMASFYLTFDLLRALYPTAFAAPGSAGAD